MLAIMSATLATEAHSHFTLIYGNRSSQSMMFRRALADLKDKYPQRLQLIAIFSRRRSTAICSMAALTGKSSGRWQNAGEFPSVR